MGLCTALAFSLSPRLAARRVVADGQSKSRRSRSSSSRLCGTAIHRRDRVCLHLTTHRQVDRNRATLRLRLRHSKQPSTSVSIRYVVMNHVDWVRYCATHTHTHIGAYTVTHSNMFSNVHCCVHTLLRFPPLLSLFLHGYLFLSETTYKIYPPVHAFPRSLTRIDMMTTLLLLLSISLSLSLLFSFFLSLGWPIGACTVQSVDRLAVVHRAKSAVLDLPDVPATGGYPRHG